MTRSKSRWRFLVGVVVFALVALVVRYGVVSSGQSQAPTSPLLPVVATAAGMTISLTNVELASDRTVLTFSIVDADPGSGPAIAQLDAPAPTDLRLDGLRWRSAALGNLRPIFTTGTDPQQITAWEFSPVFDATTDPARQVNVTWTALRFRSADPNQRGEILEGTWAFTFTPAAAGVLDSSRVVVDQQHSANGITFAVDTILLDPSRATVTYRITSEGEGNFETSGIVVQLADGSQLLPKQIDNLDGAYAATFPPFPAGSEVTVALAPILIERQQPLALTFPIDGHAIASATAGTQLDVHIPLQAAGEQFEVASIAIQDERFTIRINNVMAGHSGRVLLRYPGRDGVTLTDNLGAQYAFAGASTNFGKSDVLTSWADGSSFAFSGKIAAEASELTLKLDGYGDQARGPWEITVQLPATR